MRGRGLSERTIAESLQCLARLQLHAAYPVASVTALDIVRFLGQRQLGAASKNTYYGYLWRFYSWLSVTDDVPNPMGAPTR
ncbi:hypothetical protein MycrhDRAFT_1419 [Mycolicibacterium rhodesiae JS60]|nr:hypothetical protein MycrhDRAFT_1419 [Mycolicibacterium rhodesiae JS60]